jgi:outer membrane protein assembly factor BamD
MKNLLLVLIAVFSLSSCSSLNPWSSKEKSLEDKQKDELTAEQLYDMGEKNINKGLYKTASEYYLDIERLYPFSELAPKGQVMAAVSQYRDEEYDGAIKIIDTFISLSPGNKEVDYMYYLKALCYYDRIVDVKRDQEITLKAQQSLEEVISRFPTTKYARDAKYKLELVKDHLAGKEMEIGRYYLKRKQFISAINRFQDVVKNHQNTAQVKEALYRLVEANLSLGIREEAQKNAAILGANYPDSKWYKYSYNLMNGQKSGAKTKTGWLDEFFGGEEEIEKPRDLHSDQDKKTTWGWIKSAVGL